jgi:hypothetical protein
MKTKKEYLKEKFSVLAMMSKNENRRDLYRRINEFETGCRTRNNLVEG